MEHAPALDCFLLSAGSHWVIHFRVVRKLFFIYAGGLKLKFTRAFCPSELVEMSDSSSQPSYTAFQPHVVPQYPLFSTKTVVNQHELKMYNNFSPFGIE
jgi:hypothetical protein